MSVRQVIRMGHPTLKQVAQRVLKEDLESRWFQELLTDLRDTMKAYDGIGIAAPQIDVSKQVALIEIPADSPRYGELLASPLYTIINPVITPLSSETQEFYEGCLSVPGLKGLVRRPSHIRVDYMDVTGLSQSLELQGFLATVFQHELDHLFGKLYVERVCDLSTLTYIEEYEEFIRKN